MVLHIKIGIYIGKLLSTELEKELQFECQAKHIWTTPYNK